MNNSGEPFASLSQRLTLPLIAAPMTSASGPELVTAACLAGIVGAFPTGNCTSTEELDDWLDQIQEARAQARDAALSVGPVAANLIIRGNNRLAADIDRIVHHRVDLVISSVGSPESVIPPLHAAGIPVLADVASMHHARRAIQAGADGLVLLSAGAGGHTGWANPLAFVRAVRAEYHGPLVLAGGISDGTALWGAIVLGFDLAYMGTKFLATSESRMSGTTKDAVVAASLDDIELGMAPNGIAASLIRGGKGSAGHTVSGVTGLLRVSELVAATRAEWDAARVATAGMLGV